MEINRDEAAEIPVAGATGGGDPVPMPEPVYDVHRVVVDEVDADEAAWPEILEGVRLLKRKGKHDSGWSYFDRLAVSCPNPEHVRCSRSRSIALQMDVLGRNAPLCFLGCLVAGSMVDGSGAQSMHARHRKHATVQGRSWTLMNRTFLLVFFFHRHFLWSLGNSTLEGKPICVRVFL